ncbi:MAG TPA: hypothetical protein VE974_14940 [Thermoanaerobaculia bacterium]|nr:hypothetical protein [Thermoanaerobaculia bacterium]
MSRRLRSSIVVALAGAALFATPSALAQACSLNAETKTVFVTFEGCSQSQPGKQFDVDVGGEIITVTKQRDADLYWRGTTAETFRIGDRKLTIDALAVPRARVTCSVSAIPHPAGACVALYRVRCAQLWLVNVTTVPKLPPKKMTVDRMPPTKNTIISCSRAMTAGEDLELAEFEELNIQFDSPAVRIPLTVKTFGRKSTLTLKEVPVQVVSANAVISNSDAGDELAKKKLQRVVSEMRITKKVPVVE